MSEHLTYLVLGLGGGAVIAALAIGVVITHRASNVINFGHAAVGMYAAFAYYELRRSGELVLPVIGLPDRIALVSRPTEVTALLLSVGVAAIIGALVFLVVFRPLRTAPELARVVASLGLMVWLIGVVGLKFDGPSATSLQLDGPLPTDLVELAGIRVPADRLWLAGIVVAAAALLWGLDRVTRLGLATRAAAENERGAVLIGLSPTTIGLVNWVVAAVLAALAVILAAPMAGLDPGTTSLLVVPALGAALLGGFRSIPIAVAASLGIGMLQSEIMNLQAQTDWLPNVGLQQAVPFLFVVAALMLRGDKLPGRGTLVTGHLAPATDPRGTMPVTIAIAVAGIVALQVVDSSARSAIIVSSIAAITALSVVVLTGLVGQISLATYALAGTAGFAMVRAADSLGIGFPFAPLIGIAAATLVGVLAGLPAVRVRGLTLAVATIAASVAVEELLFRWTWFTGGDGGARPASPEIFGIDLGISAVGPAYPRAAFGVFTLVVMVAAMAVVVNLRKGATGRRWLAVRANERAAAAAGIPVAQVKVTAAAVAAALAGTAGVLLAYQRQVVSASSYQTLDSLVIVAIAFLAGIATPRAALLAGALSAGGLLTLAMETINPGSSKYQFAMNGLLLMFAAVRYPAGMVGTAEVGVLRTLSRRASNRRRPAPATAAS